MLNVKTVACQSAKKKKEGIRMKKLVSVLLCTMMLMTCLATSGVAEQEKITLTLTHWGNEIYQEMFDQIGELHTQMYPNVTVETILIPFSDYANKLAIMYASDSPPDVAWMPTEFIVQYLQNDSLIDITDEVIGDESFNFDDIYDSATAHLWVDGKLYGVPTNAAPQVLFYNKDLLQKAGLADPNTLGEDWTYDRVREYALAMNDPDNNIYGVNFIRDWKVWSGGLVHLIQLSGGSIFNDDMTEFTLNSPETAKALQYFSDLMFVDKVHPLPGDQVMFNSGQLGIFQDNYSSVGRLQDVTFDWDIAPMPYSEVGGNLWVGASAMCAFKLSDYPEEAAQLIKTITGEEGQKIAMQLLVPSRQSLQESDAFLNANTPPSEDGVRSALIDRMQVNGRAFVTPANWTTIEAAVQSGLDELYGQTMSVQECLDLIDEEVQPLFE